MRFDVLPILDQMLDLYDSPKGGERFRNYLKLLLNPDGTDLALPIAVYNPMAKAHVAELLHKLKLLDAENIMRETLTSFNAVVSEKSSTVDNPGVFRVALVVADDLHGSWTNRYTTDYQSKFELRALINRGFCTPHFWTSENPNSALIVHRTNGYVYRTIYQLTHPQPQTLEDHIRQESFVNSSIAGTGERAIPAKFASHKQYYDRHKKSTDYSTIFNFLYGETASVSLGYAPEYNCEDYLGFKIAHRLV